MQTCTTASLRGKVWQCLEDTAINYCGTLSCQEKISKNIAHYAKIIKAFGFMRLYNGCKTYS